MSRIRMLLAVGTTVILLMAFSGVADAAFPGRGATTTIRGVGSVYGSPHWAPRRVSIDHGSRVQWIAASYDHVLAAYSGNWTFRHSLPQGQSVTRRFGQAGTYLFRCTLHSSLVNGRCQGMCGKIVVH